MCFLLSDCLTRGIHLPKPDSGLLNLASKKADFTSCSLGPSILSQQQNKIPKSGPNEENIYEIPKPPLLPLKLEKA